MLRVTDVDDSGNAAVGVPGTPLLNAQQTNLVRSVIDSDHGLDGSPSRDPRTGRKRVSPLDPTEFERFRAAWSRAPVQCIRSMNRAMGQLKEADRLSRYLEAAVDLEILMDHEGRPTGSAEDQVGVPDYLVDGYTDLGIVASARWHGERIFVDKAQLRLELLWSKRQALGLPGRATESAAFGAMLHEVARLHGERLRHEESSFSRRSGGTLSDSVTQRDVNSRHLAILFQLRLQEAGVSSRLVNGQLRLFGIKLRHTWNIAREGATVGLVDVAFAEDEPPFVLTGSSTDEVYQRAAKLQRCYSPSPDSFHRYQIQSPAREG